MNKVDIIENTQDVFNTHINNTTNNNNNTTYSTDQNNNYYQKEIIPTQAMVQAQQQQEQAATASGHSFPSVVTAVYALRRGGNRSETLQAVDNLIQLCNYGGELCLPAVKQMMAAGKRIVLYKYIYIYMLIIYVLYAFIYIVLTLLYIHIHILYSQCNRSTPIPPIHPTTSQRLAGSRKADLQGCFRISHL